MEVLKAFLRRCFSRRREGLLLKNAREGLAREIVESIYDKGIGEIYIGYPKGIAQDKGNKRNTNFWSYSAIIKRIKLCFTV